MGLAEEFAAIDYSVVGVILLNFSSSVGVIFLNKWLFEYLLFRFSYSLVIIHFSFTFLGMLICAGLRIFTPKRIPMAGVIPLSLSFCGFVVLTNLSLEYNSVGVYQLCKVLTTPVIMVIEFFMYHKSTSTNVKISMFIVCTGIVMATTSDVQLNLTGTVIALVGVVVTSFYQIWVGRFQTKYEANSMQLLFYQAPVSCVFLLIGWPWLEKASLFWLYPSFGDTEFIVLVLSTCVAAFFVNLSTFLLIGKTSAVTYNAVGHGKLVAILMGGYIIFLQPVKFLGIIGCVFTVVGLIMYTRVKLSEQALAKAQAQSLEAAKPPVVETTKDEE